MKRYITLDKAVGETPLSCAEAWRAENLDYKDVPMAYAGRLDPMASGKLLILLGDECKRQTEYHDLDKTYKFSILLGIKSDSLDVLGRLSTCAVPENINEEKIITALKNFTGEIELPYPRFSAKTVKGKPLHMWTLEGRLNEIEIPTKTSIVYEIKLNSISTLSRKDLAQAARRKIDTIPEVTDPRKALGNDFRRTDVRKDWEEVTSNNSLPDSYTIINLNCLASSGTYMRTLASLIAEELGTCGLAWSIHRDKIGVYDRDNKTWKIEY